VMRFIIETPCKLVTEATFFRTPSGYVSCSSTPSEQKCYSSEGVGPARQGFFEPTVAKEG
jgi:hypothetical protein